MCTCKGQKEEIVFYSTLNEKFEIPNRPSNCKWQGDEKSNNNITSPHSEENWKRNSKLCSNIISAIGHTPLIKLNKIPKDNGIVCNIYAKCEFLNPGGSAKDRVAKRMIEDAERHGILKPGMTVIESSSGNAGIALALQAAVKGYKCIIIISEFTIMSAEKRALLNALGAELVKTSFAEDINSPNGFIGMATKLQKEIPNSIILDQFSNPASPLAHYDTTAEEIWDQCHHKVDMVVIGVGTGGTITGIGRKLKELNPNVKIVGVDPEGSLLAQPDELNRTDVNYFEVDGIGFCFVPTICDRSVVDLWIKTNDRDSLTMARRLIREEGLLCGTSSGAVLTAALTAAKKLKEGQNVVLIFADGVRNYMSTFLTDLWMESRNYQTPINKKKDWWWNYSVAQIDLKNVLECSNQNTCEEVLKIMEKHQVNQLAVVKNNGSIIGAVTQKDMVNSLIRKDVLSQDSIERIMLRSYSKADRNATLGLISRLLDVEDYVVITHQDEAFEKPLGLIDSQDLLSFIQDHEINGSVLCCDDS